MDRPQQDPAVAENPVAAPVGGSDTPPDYNRRTFDRLIAMFKWLIILVAFILLGMLVFLR